jgi:hypothetical protein
MAPAQVQYIISKAQENHAADGKESTYKGHKLGEAQAGHHSSLPSPPSKNSCLFNIAVSLPPKSKITPTPKPRPRAPTNSLTSWWGNAFLHCSSAKQFRKGKGMKQKRMIRKTAPLITPWDSGLWPSSKWVEEEEERGVVTHYCQGYK